MRTVIDIKRVDLWSFFKAMFLIYAAIGLLVGLFYAFGLALLGGIGELAALEDEGIPGLGILTGVAGLFLVPVMAFFYGVLGAVFTTIAAAIYNLAAKLTGGFRLDIEYVGPAPGAPPPPAPAIPPTPPRPPVPPAPPPPPSEQPPSAGPTTPDRGVT